MGSVSLFFNVNFIFLLYGRGLKVGIQSVYEVSLVIRFFVVLLCVFCLVVLDHTSM